MTREWEEEQPCTACGQDCEECRCLPCPVCARGGHGEVYGCNRHGMYQVFYTWDGCSNERAMFIGTREDCLKFMRRRTSRQYMRHPKGGLDLVSTETGRAESYLL